MDSAMIALDQGIIEVETTKGKTHSGGSEIDNVIFTYVCQYFETKYSITI